MHKVYTNVCTLCSSMLFFIMRQKTINLLLTIINNSQLEMRKSRDEKRAAQEEAAGR